MIGNLKHDPIFLAGKSEAATKEDLLAAQDLMDMLMVHKKHCLGKVANIKICEVYK